MLFLYGTRIATVDVSTLPRMAATDVVMPVSLPTSAGTREARAFTLRPEPGGRSHYGQC